MGGGALWGLDTGGWWGWQRWMRGAGRLVWGLTWGWIHPWHEENPLCDWTACGYVSGPLAGIWLRLWANPQTLTELR
jgi:hypothetical protein